MNTNVTYTIKPPEYKKAIADESEFFVQFHHLTPEVDSLISKIIHRYLERYDIVYIKDAILNIIKELINNAIKANIKRVYFKLNDLDIKNIDEYRQGMETFKRDTFQSEESDNIFEKLDQSNLVVRVHFKTTNHFTHINVINNVPILDSELHKITSRIKKAYKYTNISEAFEDVLDDSEGAGLGLIMAMMIYRNSGLPADSFRIYKKNDLTIATLNIPKNIIKPKSQSKVTEEILKEIEEIPSIPEHIREIQRLCNNPDSPIRSIAENISRDPGLITSLLKLANSAGYFTSKKVESIEEAVKIIGMKGINTLLIAASVSRIIDSKYKKFKTLWDDSYKRASYAQKIALEAKRLKISEFAYLAGLLSDIGGIILLSIQPENLLKLKQISGTKAIDDPGLLEEITLGLSHSTLGALVCKKWNFNESLLQAIEFHHRPHMAPASIKQLVFIVYLADCFVEIEKKKMRYDMIDEDVTELFKLHDVATVEMLHTILKDAYSSQLDTIKIK